MPPPVASVVETPKPLTGAVFSSFRLPAAAGYVRLMLVGELDLVTADLAREAVRRAQDDTRALICDPGDVWFVDRSGVGVLLDAAARATLTGGRFTITSCPAIVPRMLALLRLKDALEIQAAPPSAAAPAPRYARPRRHVS
jgi:anti-anti-sigma factor